MLVPAFTRRIEHEKHKDRPLNFATGLLADRDRSDELHPAGALRWIVRDLGFVRLQRGVEPLGFDGIVDTRHTKHGDTPGRITRLLFLDGFPGITTSGFP